MIMEFCITTEPCNSPGRVVESVEDLATPTVVAVLDLGTGRVVRLAGGDTPSWSADGSALAFSSYQDGYRFCYPDGRCPSAPQVYSMAADGTGQTRLTDDPTRAYYAPAWRTRSVLYAQCTRRLCRIEDGQVTELAHTDDATEPRVLPDGGLVYAIRRRGEIPRLTELSADGATARELHPGVHPDVAPAPCEPISACTPPECTACRPRKCGACETAGPAKLRLIGTPRRLAVVRGGIRLRVGCRPVGSGCTGAIRLMARGCDPPSYGRAGEIRIPAGGRTRVVRVRIGRAAARALRRHRRVPACLLVSGRGRPLDVVLRR